MILILILRMLTGAGMLAWSPARAVLRMLTGILVRLFARRKSDVAERATAWLANERGVGVSSRTIYDVMMGTGHLRVVAVPNSWPASWDAPHDADDFGRCARLLKLVPEWVPRLGEVSAACPPFRRLVRCWPELTRLYERGDTALLSAVIGDLRGPGGEAVRMTVRREWELVDAGAYGDGKEAARRLPPGTHDMERIRNPLGHDGYWLVLKGTRIGASEGSWRQWPRRKYAGDDWLVTFEGDDA